MWLAFHLKIVTTIIAAGDQVQPCSETTTRIFELKNPSFLSYEEKEHCVIQQAEQ